MIQTSIAWFRRDLRDHDNAALAGALREGGPVHGVFVFDTEILDALESREDPRVTFIWESVRQLRNALARRGIPLHVVHGRAREEVPALARRLRASTVHASRDYEPGAIERDEEVRERLRVEGRFLRTYKDQVVFEWDEVRTAAGEPFKVFTPYKRAWLAKLGPRAVEERACRFPDAGPVDAGEMPSLESMGFVPSAPAMPSGMSGARRALDEFKGRLGEYAALRDFPASRATSGLSPHLRFGTVSVRELVKEALKRDGEGPQQWLSEIAWRDFFFAILAVKPSVVSHAFDPRFEGLDWNDDEEAFAAWRDGRTGYPLVDAAMRELAAQGTMHNRLRMVAASFLVKDLGIDWRRGERLFAARLLDYDLAANNGNWQWCASTGCDAQPWFRIFNPVTQSRRFDPEGVHLRRWVPELARVPGKRIHAPWEMDASEQQAAGCVIGVDYPPPIVDHAAARLRALARYEGR